MSRQPIDEDDGRSRKRKRITTIYGGGGWWLNWIKTRLSIIFGATNSNRLNVLTTDLGSSMDRASGSSSTHSRWSYDVFLSFRGEDTRANFTSHLDMALRQRGINVFIDNKLPSGEEISTSLLKSIEGSRILIVIISKNYASSSWCLDELVKIIECKNFKGQMVLPIFFKVDPSDVRKQTGTFGDALARLHDQLKFSNKIQTWKKALDAVAHLAGLSVTEKVNEAEIIEQIVKKVMDKLNRPILLEVAKYPVGVEEQVTNLVSLVMSDGVTMVGIYGIGGIGKTTLAKALYNIIANQFEGCSFVANVSEASKQFNGLLNLQEMLLSEILMGDFIKISNLVHRNTNIIRDRLHSKRILLVLDDIDDYKQLEVLAGKLDWFGHGSKIIVTTRDTHLISEFDKRYFIQGLSHDKALELFGWYAFKKTISDIPSDYLDLSKRAVEYCKGLPLGLEVLGSFLYNRDQSKWKSILDSYEKSSLDKRIQDILQISYNGLEDEIKELFLDISCLFVGEHIDDVKAFLEACGSYPEKGIGILTDLLLVTIILHHLNRTLMRERIQMHDLIQQMGRTIALSKFSNPRKRKRLFTKDDVEDVLNDNKEAGAVKAIKLNFSKPTKLDIGAQGFRNVKNLMFLKIHGAIFSGDLEYLPSRLKWIDWPEFPFSSFPLGFTPKNVIKLNLLRSSIKHLGGVMNWESLKQICLQGSKFLTEIPDFSTALNLEWLDLEECTSLVKVHESVGSLGKLVYLNLRRCFNLEKLPSHLKLKSLQQLELSGCVTLEEFPHIGEEMKSCVRLTKIYVGNTNIKELPLSIVNLHRLRELGIFLCTNFTSLPLYCLLNLEDCSIVLCSSFTRISCPCPFSFSFSSSSSSVLLPNLRTLQLSYCNISDLSFLEILSQSAPFLAYLDLSGNEFSSLPCWMVNFESLTSLVIHDCKSLEDISKVPECIHQILAEGCISLVKYPDNIADIISYNLDYEDEVEFGYREFVLVNWDIPDWYFYKKANNNDNSITFWMSDDESRKLKGLAPSIVIEGRGHPTTSYDDFPVQSRVSPSTNVLRQPRDKRSFHHGSHDDFLVEIRVSLSANGSRQIHGERSFHYVSLCAHTWLLVFGVENFTQMDEKCNDTNEREIDGGICFKVLFEIISGKEMVFIKNCGVHLIYEEDDD